MIKESPSAESDALKFGYAFNALTDALIKKANNVSLTPRFSASTFIDLRKSSKSVMSASSNCVTCGAVTQLRCKFAPDNFLIRESGVVLMSPNLVKSITGIAKVLNSLPPAAMLSERGLASSPFTKFCTSACRMRFFFPEPCTNLRSTPSSRANLRIEGLACELTSLFVSTCAPIGIGLAAGCTCFGGSGAGRVGSGIAALDASSFAGFTSA